MDNIDTFKDIEMEEAKKANEKEIYYKVYKVSNNLGSYTIIFKRYKPSVARILTKRTGIRMVPIVENTKYVRHEVLYTSCTATANEIQQYELYEKNLAYLAFPMSLF